ncbi:MAG TPA: DNA polymerase Y family protein [Caulobacteraceae bacterium]
MTRILSVWSATWPIAVWRRKNPSAFGPEKTAHPRGKKEIPLALVISERGVRRLYAVDEVAGSLGLYAGQKAADAAALAPELVTADADPEGDLDALNALADWCVRFSPAVAPDPPDGLLIDITGVDHLWGGEAAMLDDLIARLAASGIPARAAIADTAGAAWALARYSPEKIAPPGGQAPLLEPLSAAALRLDEVAAAQLPRLGLTKVGRVMKLPRAQLTRRFGKGVVRRLDQALGRVDEALTFRRPATPWFERLAFAEPISAPDDLARATADITARLCARLEREGKGGRRFEVAFHRLDGKVQTAAAGLSLAGRDAARVAKLIAPRLDVVDPGFGIQVVTMTAEGVEAISPRQQRLDAGREAALEEGLAPLIDRLSNRLGEDRVWRAEPFESHIPERSVVRKPPLEGKAGQGWDPDRPRPIRLFRKPEPIDAVTALVPDDPPVRFRWRGRMHRVLKAEGPERLGEEWWRRPIGEVSPDRVRDYYRVEDEGGQRFWLFRAGLYDPQNPPKWWLHGLFG